MTRDDYDPSCFACGVPRTINGHLCWDCYRARLGTIHARWTDREYIAATITEVAILDKRNAEQLASRKRTEERRAA